MAEQHEPEQLQSKGEQTTFGEFSCGFNLGLMDAALSACGGGDGGDGGAGSAPAAQDSAAAAAAPAGPSGADIDGGTTAGNGSDVTAGRMAGLSLDSSTAAAATDNGTAVGNAKTNNDAEGAAAAEPPPIAQQRQQTTAASNHWGRDRIDFSRRCALRRYDEEDRIIMAEEANKATTCTDPPEKTQTEKTEKTKPAPTPSKNTKVKRKSSTLGALSSPFSSSLRSSSSKASSMKSPQKQKELPNQPVPPNTWSPISASKFAVRTGPNYASTGRKLPSLESLYDVVAVRMYTSSRRTAGAGEVPSLPLPADVDFKPSGTASLPPVEIPSVLIVHVQMPHDAPSMFQPSTDGPGTECVLYLRPSRQLLAETSGAAPMAPATNLFLKWCQTAATDAAMRGRFKCMALVRNLEAHNLGWVAPYNGKPVLITESGTCRVGALPVDGCGNNTSSADKNSSTSRTIRYLEMTANVHRWGYLAKKGFVSLLPKFRELRLDIGFTIEGRADDELPECVLGCFAANFCDEGSLERIPDELLK